MVAFRTPLTPLELRSTVHLIVNAGCMLGIFAKVESPELYEQVEALIASDLEDAMKSLRAITDKLDAFLESSIKIAQTQLGRS